MANDGELNFKTKIDDSDLDKGLSKQRRKGYGQRHKGN